MLVHCNPSMLFARQVPIYTPGMGGEMHCRTVKVNCLVLSPPQRLIRWRGLCTFFFLFRFPSLYEKIKRLLQRRECRTVRVNCLVLSPPQRLIQWRGLCTSIFPLPIEPHAIITRLPCLPKAVRAAQDSINQITIHIYFFCFHFIYRGS